MNQSQNFIQMTWLGQSGFYIETLTGKKILIDPWINGNSLFPPSLQNKLEADYILITHGHSDHASDVVALAKTMNATVVAGFELGGILKGEGVSSVIDINPGGTRQLDDISVTAVQAFHSSGYMLNGRVVYAGDPLGFVINFEDGYTVYHSGDTNVFGDMSLVAELYQPDLVVLPIGDVYTMGPREAAKAVELLQAKQVVPMHFGLDFLTGTRQDFVNLLPDSVEVFDVQGGSTIQIENGMAILLK